MGVLTQFTFNNVWFALNDFIRMVFKIYKVVGSHIFFVCVVFCWCFFNSSRLCNWLSLRCLVPWINHLPPVCWSTFGILVWNDSGYVNLTQWWYFFINFEYILHISTPHIMIFVFLYLIFLSQQVLYFLLSTLVLTLYIDVVLSLSTSR